MAEFQKFIIQLTEGENLTVEQSSRAFQIIMHGGATPAQIAAFLTAIKMKGESSNELVGAAQAMRIKCRQINAPEGTIDTCGTGGDNSGSLNISTTTAVVVAGAGVPVAKHGNKGITSKSGSSDILSALGVNINCRVETVQKCMDVAKICFMMAPIFHTSTREALPVRQELGFRTIFNLLGPLTNPARVKRQLIGVYSPHLLPIFAEATHELAYEKAWIVNGSGTLDELSIAGESKVAEMVAGEIDEFTITPSEAGLPEHTLDDIKGGSPHENAHAVMNLLKGHESPFRDAVLLNSAAALIVAGKTNDLKEGVEIAKESIDSGNALAKLAKLAEISNSE